MRSHSQLAVWATLLSATLAHAQTRNLEQDLIALNTMQLLSGGLPCTRLPGNSPAYLPPPPLAGPSTPAVGDAPGASPRSMTASFADVIQRVGYVQPAQATSECAAPGCTVPTLATGPCCPPVTPCAPEPPPPAPQSQGHHEERAPYHRAINYGSRFPECCEFLQNLTARFDGTFLPDLIYHSALLNLLWRLNCEADPEVPYRVWVQGEYLQWRMKSAPIAVPLVTGNNDPAALGALGEAGTTVLFGAGSNQSTSFNNLSGGRLTVGWWHEKDCPFGLEASGFLLEQGRINFSAGSAGGLAPIVSIPFFATQPFNFINAAGETALNAGGAPNLVSVNLSSQLWGAEANVLFDPWGDYANYRNDFNSPLRMLAIFGARYLDLLERLSLSDTFFDPTTNGTIGVADRFVTRNQFVGLQLGGRVNWCFGRWSLDGTGKIAIGDNHQSLNVNGATTVTGGAFGFGTGTTAGGVFGEPSNNGSFRHNVFAYVPEGQLKLYYELTQSIRPFVGYNFIYLNQAIRPGNQLDRNINPTQNVFFSVPPGTIVGPLTPLPMFRSSDFWAQGFNIGVECRF